MPDRSITVLLFLRRVDCNDGVASYCESIIRGLRARGDKIVIVSGPVTQLYGSATRHAAILENVLEWVVIDDLERSLPKLSSVSAVLATIKKYAVDVISPQGFSLVPLSFVLSKLSKVPVAVNYHPTTHGSSPASVPTSRSWKTKLKFRAIATLFPADRFIAISKDIVTFFHDDCKIPNARISYIPHGIDIEYFRPPTAAERQDARQALSLPDDAIVCVLPGRLNMVKGHDVAIDAIRILRQTKPSLRVICLFAGGGDEAEKIERYAYREEADRDAFRFIGFLGVEALRQAYWASEIGLLPSRFEGFPLSVPEAMSSGCVSIRTPSGGWEDQIIDGVNGFIVPFNDPQALADSIEHLSDPVLYAAMRENAIGFARRTFDQVSMLRATADLYHTMVLGSI